jgi:hypothetical protein
MSVVVRVFVASASGFPFPDSDPLVPRSCGVESLARRVRTLSEELQQELQDKITSDFGVKPTQPSATTTDLEEV